MATLSLQHILSDTISYCKTVSPFPSMSYHSLALDFFLVIITINWIYSTFKQIILLSPSSCKGKLAPLDQDLGHPWFLELPHHEKQDVGLLHEP